MNLEINFSYYITIYLHSFLKICKPTEVKLKLIFLTSVLTLFKIIINIAITHNL